MVFIKIIFLKKEKKEKDKTKQLALVWLLWTSIWVFNIGLNVM